ncbi:MAG: hypothetical protein ACRDKY_12670 [Solirubrobacteraceae bacterium]
MSERGQATIDYTTLLALVAGLLAAVAALVPGGARGVANAVQAQTAHALCIVTGKACRVDRARPCTVAMRRETRHYGLTVGIVRLDKDRFVVREQLSDGTVRLTVLTRLGGGVEFGVGGRVQIDQDLNSGGLDREARVAAQGVQGVGKVYVARNAREADRIMDAISDGDDPPVPAREIFLQGGIGGFGTFSIGRGVVDLDWTSTRLLTVRMNRRTGAMTLSFSLGSGGRALAGAVVGGPGGVLDGTAVFGLTLDRRKRPVELSLLAVGEVAAGARLPSALAAPLALSGDANAPANLVGRRWEFAARLDLRDPEVAAAWKRFRRSPASLAAIRGLARALRERAHLDARTYSARNSSNGTALGLSLGLRLGGEMEHMVDRFNLIAASSRPPGGLWEPRLDCV